MLVTCVHYYGCWLSVCMVYMGVGTGVHDVHIYGSWLSVCMVYIYIYMGVGYQCSCVGVGNLCAWCILRALGYLCARCT